MDTILSSNGMLKKVFEKNTEKNTEKDSTTTTTRLPSEDLERRYLSLARERKSEDPWVGLLSAAVQQVRIPYISYISFMINKIVVKKNVFL